MNKLTEASMGPLDYASVGSDSWPDQVMVLQRQRDEARRLLAHTFTTFIDGERCWCHPASQPTSDTHSAFCLDARAHTRDLIPPKKL